MDQGRGEVTFCRKSSTFPESSSTQYYQLGFTVFENNRPEKSLGPTKAVAEK